ncbi:MAG: hypothetical protein RBR03_00835 [Desulfuromonas thiophila]|jgi:flagellar biosynthesis/type III secretory pathway chaperone|nr:hypothetical protein [Desulfuromonas thiophila]MDD3801197.1 hypothetical protein [Desulfuromonas thiophila]MDY0397190.1 hypothetical protein [Desulfuromonas thiophila]
MNAAIRQQLHQLHELILLERQQARELQLDALQETVQRKEKLLAELDFDGIDALAAEERELVERIRFDNRRNAYLLWSALNWIRQSMEFFGRKSRPDSYNPQGMKIQAGVGGRLLSGRI